MEPAAIDVSVVIACYNAAAFLEAAVRSALDQAGVAVEVLVVDDHSSDASLALAYSLASADPRVRILQTPRNGGPAAARNIGFVEARGRWISVLDSDDLMAAQRLLTLVEAADDGVDIIADDLVVFEEGCDRRERFLGSLRGEGESTVGLADYLAETRMYGKFANLGFLKPLFCTAFLRRHGLAYDENLRIAEDDDLILQCLCAGANYRIVPTPTYLYRKHAASISYRLRPEDIDRMLAREAERLPALESRAASVRKAARLRYRSMVAAWAFTHAMDDAKAGRFVRSSAVLAVHPAAWPLLKMPISAKLKRLAIR